MSKNLVSLLNESVEKYNDKILYGEFNLPITYNRFLELVKKLASSLKKLGIENKNIAIVSENRYEWELAFFGILFSGNTVVPIDKELPKEEIEGIINRVSAEVVFYSEKYEKTINEIMLDTNCLKYAFLFESTRENSIDNLLIDGGKFEEPKDIDDNVACIFFTSGTTTSSKAVMLTHKNIYTNVKGVSEVLDITSGDRALSVLPLNHVLEGLFCFLTTINLGLERYFCNDLEDIMKNIKWFGITYMGAVPAIYKYLLNYKSELVEIKDQINTFMSGGAKLEEDVLKEYKEIGINLIQGYGMTETAPVITMENKANNKFGSVGKVIPSSKIKINNPDNEGVGEILVSGENIFKMYFQNEEATSECKKDEYFYTGDLGYIDDEGYLFITGRLKNLIVLDNGKKVFPEELEQLLNKIVGVKESLVYFDGKVIKAKLVYDANEFFDKKEDEIKNILDEKVKKLNDNLAVYKKIARVDITGEELAKTVNGKVKREIDNKNIVLNENKCYNLNDENLKDCNNTFEKIKEIIIEQLGIDDVSENSNFRVDLGADSLDVVEIFLKVEKMFDIKINKANKKNIIKVKDLLKIL